MTTLGVCIGLLMVFAGAFASVPYGARWLALLPFGIAIVVASAWMDERTEPCAHVAYGVVETTDEAGNRAWVRSSWCAEYKPGRAPDAGSSR